MKRAIWFATLCFLAACGGGGGGSSNTPPPPPVQNASPGGIWQGTDSATGLTVLGLVDEGGDGHFIESDGVQYVGQVNVTGNAASADFDGYAPVGTTFADGSVHGTGTFTGTVQERSSVTGTTVFTTDGGHQTTGTLTLNFDSLYDRASALATLAGTFTDPITGGVFSVDDAGNITGQDPVSNCTVGGAAGVIDATYNAYIVKVSFSGCVGTYSVFNGGTLGGLITLDNQVSPEELIAALSGTVNGVKVALALRLNRS